MKGYRRAMMGAAIGIVALVGMFAAPAAEAKKGKWAMNSQMQHLKAQQKEERQACKTDPAGLSCGGLKDRQRQERKDLKQQLRGKNK